MQTTDVDRAWWTIVEHFRDRAIRAETALGEPDRAAEWKAIEDAPRRNGHHLLMYGSGEGFMHCVFIGVWSDYDQDWQEAYSKKPASPRLWREIGEAKLGQR